VRLRRFTGVRRYFLLAALAVIMGTAVTVEARVLKIEIFSRASLFEGRTFGTVGAYEQIRGIAYGELNPGK
jgi:hypothetical protein